MKKLLMLSALVLTSQAFGQQLIESKGTSGLLWSGGNVVVMILGHSAAKITRDMTEVRVQNSGFKFGRDIVCEGRIRGRNQSANKRCVLLITDPGFGELGLGGGFSRNDLTHFGESRAYHQSGSTGFGVIEVTGAPAEILWKTLGRNNPSGAGNQRSGERYTCDKFENAGRPVKYRCEFMLERMSDGTIGDGGVG